ncbi:hypothetical protein [uncultured Massilia sp.]|uniref:hypothetical protein n=1 Tax=uncultured Massilia sp. TaxID=169973 RepID=UPI0025D8E650|nr:hypothetical protein [uncultured Massilia sp.]
MSPIRIPTFRTPALLALALAAACFHPPARAQDTPVGDGASYAVVRHDGQDISATGKVKDWDALRKTGRQVDGEFLWVNEGGKSWVIRDAATVAQARAAWAPVERLGKRMDAYGKDMDRHGKAMDALGKDMDRSARGMEPDQGRIRALERRMGALGTEMGEVGARMATADAAERGRLQARMAVLQREMNRLGGEMHAATRSEAQQQAERDMRQASLRMEAAHKPMDALGKQMEALGKEMAQESQRADKTVRTLVREAMARGLARPAPQG